MKKDEEYQSINQGFYCKPDTNMSIEYRPTQSKFVATTIEGS